MINELFDRTLKKYKISAKEISKLTKISEGHISEFRKGKADVTTENLEKLLNAMDKLCVGSKKDFCEHLAGEKIKPSNFVQTASNEELEETLYQIIKRLFPKNNDSDNESKKLAKKTEEYVAVSLF